MSKNVVVCVDDEALILLSLRASLRNKLGPQFSCETAISGQSALELIEELIEEGEQVHTLVSDWLMPGMNGDELIRKVHSLYPEIRLIILTGFADRQIVSSLEKDIPIKAVFHKPCSIEELTSVITG